jgi:hypothetical protein
MDEVFFGVGGSRVACRYDRKKLILGSIVHVTGTADGGYSFSDSPTSGSIPHSVLWISPSEWYVELVTGPKTDHAFSKRLADALELTDVEPWIEEALRSSLSYVRLSHTFLSSELENSEYNAISTVVERLELVARLGKHEISEELAHHYEPLVAYLMLTCFDRLGQPAEWMDFSSWLNSRRHAKEREGYTGSGMSEEVALWLHRRYLEIYGTRSAFFRFLKEVLPSVARRSLLDHIRFERLSNPPEIRDLIIPDADEEKERWLFRMRNDYTHKARFIRGLPKGFLGGMAIPEDAWIGREQRVESSYWSTMYLRGWPTILVQTVRLGLISYLKK